MTGEGTRQPRDAKHLAAWRVGWSETCGETTLGVTLGDVVGLLVCNPVHAESLFFLKGRKVVSNNLTVLKTATSFTSKIQHSSVSCKTVK